MKLKFDKDGRSEKEIHGLQIIFEDCESFVRANIKKNGKVVFLKISKIFIDTLGYKEFYAWLKDAANNVFTDK